LDGSEHESGEGGGPRASERPGEPINEADELQRIRALPKEIGALLIVAGIGGLMLPGPIGSPFLIMGGVVLWPRTFERVEVWFEKRFPTMHHQSVRQIKRFLDDMERRYPLSK
jgi:hypothetical protein